MIDKLISSDLAALAAEDRQAVPSLAALRGSAWVKPAKVPRDKRMLWLWPISPVVFVLVGSVVLSKLDHDFMLVPQLPVALAIALVAFVGLLVPGISRTRDGTNLLAAAGFIPLATVASIMAWHRHLADCAFFDGDGMVVGPCERAPWVTTTESALVAWAAVVMIAMLVTRWIRWDRMRAWNIPAALAVIIVLLTWLGVNEYMDTWREVARFHEPWLRYGAALVGAHDVRVMLASPEIAHGIAARTTAAHWSAIEVGALLLGLAISVGVASTRERGQPSRWLRLLEHPLVIPLGVTAATVVLVGQLVVLHLGDWDDVRWSGSWASIGAVVAYASMLLRRRRREALS